MFFHNFHGAYAHAAPCFTHIQRPVWTPSHYADTSSDRRAQARLNLLRPPALRDDNAKSMPSKGTSLPPEIWYHIVQNATIVSESNPDDRRRGVTRKNMCSLALVCRYWAGMWRPLIFATTTLGCVKHVQDLAELLLFETPHVPSVGKYVKELVILQRYHPPVKWQPWLHTVYILLHQSLLCRGSTLTVHVEFDDNSTPAVDLDDRRRLENTHFTKRSSHDLLPQSILQLRPRCQDLVIKRTRFRSDRDIVRLLSGVRASLRLTLEDTVWDTADIRRPTPVTIRYLSISGAVRNKSASPASAFRLIASRKIGDAIYELIEQDIKAVINILVALRAESRCQYIVEEATGRQGHACKLLTKPVFGPEWTTDKS